MASNSSSIQEEGGSSSIQEEGGRPGESSAILVGYKRQVVDT